MSYVELQITSNFSFLRGASQPDELAGEAFGHGYETFAITDRNTLAGVVRAHGVAKRNDMRLIVGCRLDLRDGPSLLAYPTDLAAYNRLSKLLTLGMRRTKKGECELYRADVFAAAEGMKMIVVCPEDIDKSFEGYVKEYASQFGRDLYVAVSHYYRGNDIKRIAWLSRLAKQYSAKLVATNDVHYHIPERRELQDVLTCVREKCTIQNAGYRLFGNAERHLKSAAEMKRLFERYPEAIRNTVEIAKACTFSLDELKYEYPDELTTEGRTPQQELEFLVRQELAKRFGQDVPEKITALIEKEFALIEQLKFASYFLTVQDTVRFANECGILCQGRGSAANSAVCYYLGVTPVDPLKHEVLVERFISVERNEPPDIDIDHEHERREEIMQYVFNKYGRHRAAIVANVITYKQRSAIRDIGKAMGLSLDIIEKLVSTVWRHTNDFPTPDMLGAMGFDASDPHLFKTIGLMAQVLGFPRHLSQHSGGFIIAKGDLSELCPIMNASKKDRTCVIWDKDDLDELGFVKVDLLSLGILTAISKCFKLIKKHKGIDLTLANLPQDDPNVYKMISAGNTIGVFQVESRAQMVMAPKLKVNCFYDLAVQIALVRPGPMQGGMVNPYILRRQGKQPVTYASEAAKKILERTYGVAVFQEQAMKLAIDCAGFTPDEANLMRKRMSKIKIDPEEHAKWESKLVNGMLERGYKQKDADEYFAYFKSFTSYGFPESHSVSFAHLVYASAWLKYHHHDAFTCAMLNSQPMGFYLPSQLEQDARRAGVPIRPIDVNLSDWDCTLEEKTGKYHALRLGMRNVKGLQQQHVQQLVDKRGDGYVDIAAIRQRTGMSKATLVRLAKADAFRSMGLDRREALWIIQGLGHSLLEIFGQQPGEGLFENKMQLPAMSDAEHVLQDYLTTSLSLKGHPVSFIRDRLTRYEAVKVNQLRQMPKGRYIKVAGIATHRQAPETAKGTVFITLEDETGLANVIVPPHVKEKFRKDIMNGTVLYAAGILQEEDTVLHIVARTIDDVSQWITHASEQGQLNLPMLVPRADEIKHGRVGSNRGKNELVKSRDFK